MFTLILTVFMLTPGCSGPSCVGYSTIASVPGFDTYALCDQAGGSWLQSMKQPAGARYVCAQLRQSR